MLLPPGSDIIIMGVFNADMGHLGGPQSSTQLNEQGKILHRYILHLLSLYHLTFICNPLLHCIPTKVRRIQCNLLLIMLYALTACC